MKRPALVVLFALLAISAGSLIEYFLHRSPRRPPTNPPESAARTEDPKVAEPLSPHEASGIIQNVQAPYQPADVVMPLRSASDFPELPEDFRELLVSRGCQIPGLTRSASAEDRLKGVISGDFAQSGQTDWAAVCEKDNQSSIVVFWGKPTACDSELAAEPNDDFIEGEGGPPNIVWKFERAMSPVTSRALLDQIKDDKLSDTDPEHYAGGGNWVTSLQANDRVGSPPPDYPNLTHSAIGDYGRHDESVVWYCSEGRWYVYNSFAE